MSYDHWKTTPPDDGDEPLPPAPAEEERAEAWEYWHQRATKLKAMNADMLKVLKLVAHSTPSHKWIGHIREAIIKAESFHNEKA